MVATDGFHCIVRHIYFGNGVLIIAGAAVSVACVKAGLVAVVPHISAMQISLAKRYSDKGYTAYFFFTKWKLTIELHSDIVICLHNIHIRHPGPVLLTRFNANLSMDRLSHAQNKVGRNYLPIPELQHSCMYTYLLTNGICICIKRDSHCQRVVFEMGWLVY